MSTLLLNKRAVRELIDMHEVIKAVEQAFKEWDEGKAEMPPKSYILLDKGDFRAMPAALPGAVGVKWVNVHPGNPRYGLPTVMAVIIYSDPDTGYPLAIIDGTDITAYRTGATAAIAAKYMARPDAKTLGIIGAGRQAYTQIMAHVEVFNFDRINVFDPVKAATERLISSFPQYPLKETSAEEATASNVVCTLTPAHAPVVKEAWIKPGTHINAVGADAEGKEELEPSILKKARVVVDDLRQASAAGEINVPVSKGLYSVEEVYATLGEVVSGKKPGRPNKDAITIFDSTGVAIEDMATAKLIYDKAKRHNGCMSVELV